MSNATWGALAVGFVAAVVACGGDKPTPKPQPQPTVQPEVVPAPEPAPEPVAEGGAAPTAGGAGGGAAVAPEEPRRPSGRPAIMIGPSSEIKSTFGLTPGAVLKLKAPKGNITFKLPEYSLSSPANLHLTLLKKRIKTKYRVLSSIVKLEASRTDRNSLRAFSAADSSFELRWPVKEVRSSGGEGFNVAIGTMQMGSAGEVGPISWVVVGPSSAMVGEANFSLTSLGPVQYFHATNAEATATE